MGRFWFPVALLVAGLTITFAVRIEMLGWNQERASAEFSRRSQNVSTVLSYGIYDYVSSLESVKNLSRVYLESSPEEYSGSATDFVALKEEWTDIKRYFSQTVADTQKSCPGFSALGWVYASNFSDLKELEVSGKWLIKPDYLIHEVDGGGELLPVVERDDHFIAYYVEPLRDNDVLTGLDLGRGDITRLPIQRARDTGQMTATEPSDFIRRLTGQLGFLAFLPIYNDETTYDTVEERRANLHSLAVGAVLIEDMLNSSLGGLSEEGIDFYVIPGEPTTDGNPIYEDPVFSSNGIPDSLERYQSAGLDSDLRWESLVDVLGNNWVLYSYPTEAFLASYETEAVNVVTFCGLLISVLLSLYVVRSMNRTERISSLVAERTSELTQSNIELQRESVSRRQAERERMKLESQLAQATRMESIGELAGGIAHDFNNLLMGIFGHISLAKEEFPENHPAHESLHEAESSMNRATHLTNQLLTFAKGGDPVKKSVHLAPVVNEVVHFALSGSNVLPVVEVEEDLRMADADIGQLQQVFSNLAINANESMPGGGHLNIRLENVENHEDAIPNLDAGKYIRCIIRDEGMGISPKHLDRIFEPYFSTKQRGSGLGLATVYSIVNKHGGQIRVESELGEGTTFTLYIPASEGVKPLESKPAAVDVPMSSESARVLIVDDDEAVIRVASKMLENIGYSTAQAKDGLEALEMYREAMNAGEPYDVLIVDLTIPGGMGGEEAMREILKIDPDAQGIVSSGYADDPVMANFEEYGFKGVAVKPYTPSGLRNVVRDVLDKKDRVLPFRSRRQEFG